MAKKKKKKNGQNNEALSSNVDSRKVFLSQLIRDPDLMNLEVKYDRIGEMSYKVLIDARDEGDQISFLSERIDEYGNVKDEVRASFDDVDAAYNKYDTTDID